MEELHDKFKDRGFEILAFPCGQFLNQEGRTDADCKNWVTQSAVEKGIVQKPMAFQFFSKSDVNGRNVNPVFRYLKSQPNCGGPIAWNFTGKFLISRDGSVVLRTSDNSSDLHAKVEELVNAPTKVL
mmetsp:Transcript_35487/g.90669  ORF Transcript_35487/g.90669 Transcript_35487/m.90669 type:complete len:127 (-) Transcript_35487:266-646(-)